MDSYYNTKRFKAVLKSYEDGLKSGNNAFLDSDDLVEIAQFYYSMGRRNDAVEVIQYALRIFPGAVGPLALLSRMALFHENDTEKARRLLSQIEDKQDVEYSYLKAEIMMAEKDFTGASCYLDECHQSIDKDMLDEVAMDVCGLFLDYDRVDEAELWLNRVQDTDSEGYREMLGRVKLGKGNAEESERIFNSLVDRNPFSGAYWNLLAVAQLRQNDVSKSVESSDYALAINPDDIEALLNKGNAMNKLSNYKEAEKCYKRYLKLMPDNASVMASLSMAIISQDELRHEEAMAYLVNGEEVARRTGDDDALCEVLQDKAFLLSMLGTDVDHAISLVDEAMKLSLQHLSNEYFVLKGYIYLQNGEVRKAQTEFYNAIKESDFSEETALRIAVSYYDNAYVHLAYLMLKHVLKIYGKHVSVDIYAYMAMFCRECGKDDEYEMYRSLAYEMDAKEATRIFSTFSV